MQPLLTILACFHREGYIAYPALRSAVAAVEAAGRNGIDCQIVAVIDRGDATTRNCIQRFSNHLAAVHEVDFGEPSASRNYAIERIDSKYVATLDGDDLVDRDWLWKGVRFLEECGDANVVAHPELRLSFGTELHGRLQISTDSHLFHPLNLISSWHYAADLIMPTQLYKKYPQLPYDHQNGLGAEDWHWTCESVVDGIRHAIVPESCSFYRRQANHVSLGMLPLITFAPTRLFDKGRVEAYDKEFSSTGIRFAGSLESVTGSVHRWSHVPDWVERSVRNACELDYEIYNLYSKLDSIPFETPAYFPAVGQLYLRLMSQVSVERLCIVFVCDRLESLNLSLIDSFLAVYRQHHTLKLDVLILALTRSMDRPVSEPEVLDHAADSGQERSQVRVRYFDLGNEPGFVRLWGHLQKDVIVRFLMQAHPELVVNLTSMYFDRLIGDFGRAIASVGTRTIRICPGEDEKTKEAQLSWWSLTAAKANYTTVLCESADTADWLSAGFKGTGTQIHTCKASQGVETRSIYAEALRELLSQPEHTPVTSDSHDEIEQPAAISSGDFGKELDITCIMTVQSEGHYLNATLRSVAIMCKNAANQGFSSELVVVAQKVGSRTSKVLESLADVVAESRVVFVEEQNVGEARNAGIKIARGRFIAMLTGSSLLSPDWLYQAAQLAQKHGPDIIVHPHAVVEYGVQLSTYYQPDFEQPELLATDQVWTVHALARRDLFQQIPYRSSPLHSGYGHSVWHWNCETIMAGITHAVVRDTAVYCREAGFLGEQTKNLGAVRSVTLPPTRFFTEHLWLTDAERVRMKTYPRLPREWNDDAYLSRNPEVGQLVAAGRIRTGYDHFMLHGCAEGRKPCWYVTNETGSGVRTTTASIRNAGRFYWVARFIWHWRNICATLRNHGIKGLVFRTKTNSALPAQWNEEAYLQKNPGAAKAVGESLLTGYEHYCNCGRADGLDPDWNDQDPQKDPGSGSTEIVGKFPLPSWMDRETRLFGEFEPAFMPSISGKAVLGGKWSSPIVDVYRSCWRMIAPVQPTHVILMHSLRTGGAELSALHTMEAILSSPSSRVLVITAENGDDLWQDRLPDGATWLPFSAMAASCDYEQQIEVLTRLLINCGARCLHISYSWYGWDLLIRHAAALANRMQLFLSIFSVALPDLGVGAGYARDLPPLIPYLAGVLTDNEHTAQQLCSVSGIDTSRVTVLRHPVTVKQRFSGPSQDCNTVLWASRIDKEKRPDLLIQIAELLPSVEFHVYGKSVFGDDQLLEQVKAVGNIKYCGPYSGFETIPQVPYAMYLYTSHWDGLPNAVLEAMQSGLLVVASDVGGISEVVQDDTGILIRDFDNAEAYVSMVRDVLNNPDSYRGRAETGRKQIAGRFTKQAFLESLQRAPDYL